MYFALLGKQGSSQEAGSLREMKLCSLSSERDRGNIRDECNENPSWYPPLAKANCVFWHWEEKWFLGQNN